MMKWLTNIIAAALLLIALPAFAEIIHLKTGEKVKGRIIGIDDETVTIESEQGYGILQVPRDNILIVEYEDDHRDLSKMIGLGYFHRSTPTSGTGAATEYAVDSLSLKYWLDRDVSFDVQLGFFSTSDKKRTQLEIFSLDLRLAKVFKRQAELDLYYGGSVGYLSVEDKEFGVDGTGNTITAFLGVEIFFVTLPNLGISAEVGIGTQTVDKRSTTSISSTTFPNFSMRYYF